MANYVPTHSAEAKRIALQNELETLLGARRVYFQNPPSNIKLSYPCIIFERQTIHAKYACDNVYVTKYEYRVTVIDTDVDSIVADKMSKFPTSKYIRHYTSDGLSHDVFKINY